MGITLSTPKGQVETLSVGQNCFLFCSLRSIMAYILCTTSASNPALIISSRDWPSSIMRYMTESVMS